MRECSICTHSKRSEIEDSIFRGIPYRRIAETYGLTIGSISRHRNSHIQQPEPIRPLQSEHSPEDVPEPAEIKPLGPPNETPEEHSGPLEPSIDELSPFALNVEPAKAPKLEQAINPFRSADTLYKNIADFIFDADEQTRAAALRTLRKGRDPRGRAYRVKGRCFIGKIGLLHGDAIIELNGPEPPELLTPLEPEGTYDSEPGEYLLYFGSDERRI